MKRLDTFTVELTEAEWIVNEWFNDMLDRGCGIDEAVAQIRGAGVPEGLRSPRPHTEAILADHEFIIYLTD